MSSSFRQSLHAILYACLGYFLFCIVDTMAKYLTGDYSAFEILGLSALVGTVIVIALIVMRHGWSGLIHPQWGWYVGRGVTQAISSTFVVSSLVTIPLADFYGIIFLSPMLATVLAALFLKEKIGLYRVIAIILGFIGVIIICGPSFATQNIGYLLALCAAFFSAMGGIFIRKIGDEPIILRYALYPFFFATIFMMPVALYDGLKSPGNLADFSLIIGIAPIVVVAMIFYSLGFARARDIAAVAPFHYTQIIWGSLFGYLLFHDVPGIETLLGTGLIIAAGLLVIWREHVHHSEIAKIPPENAI
jgi:drug/metabolite transporter (DMT)-like permease